VKFTSRNRYPCRIIRHWMGHWCGYVGIDIHHPFYCKRYNDSDEVTKFLFSHMPEGNEQVGKRGMVDILHTAVVGPTYTTLFNVFGGITFSALDDGLWWLGIDTAHITLSEPVNTGEGVREELESLAEQLEYYKQVLKKYQNG